MNIYELKVFGEVFRISADFSQASSPIFIEIDEDEWTPTQYQVADFCHDSGLALKTICFETYRYNCDDEELEELKSEIEGAMP